MTFASGRDRGAAESGDDRAALRGRRLVRLRFRSRLARPSGRAARRVRRAFLAMVAFVLVAGFAFGPASPANAYTWQHEGGYGYSSVTPLYVNQANEYYRPWREIASPVAWVGRTNAVPWNLPQRVTVQTILQKYGSTWVTVATPTATVWVNPNEQNRQVVPGVIGRYPAGYYRAFVAIQWYDNNGNVKGTRIYSPNSPADQKCNITTCRSNYGWVQLW